MMTRIVPGCFKKAFFGQYSPEFNATGTSGTFKACAKRVPPCLNLPSCPGGNRVPSGKITIQKPSFIRSCPWLISC